MRTLSIQVEELIAHNLSIIAMYAFSREPLQRMLQESLEGEWEGVNLTVFSVAKPIAERAFLELAMLFRYLDDEYDQALTEYLNHPGFNFGRLINADETEVALKPRDVANKIIHAASFTVNSSNGRPTLICHGRSTNVGDGERKTPRKGEDWRCAEIDVATLIIALGGMAPR